MPSPRTLQHWAVVGFALLAALLVTAFATIHQSRSNERMARLRFDELTRAATAHVEQRVRAYAGLVEGVRAWVLADPQIDQQQFSRGVGGYRLEDQYPEIRALRFERLVAAPKRPALEDTSPAHPQRLGEPVVNGAPPPAAQGTDHYVVEMSWPPESMSAKIGLDVASQPRHLALMREVRERHLTVLSGPMAAGEGREPKQILWMRAPVFDPDAGSKRSNPLFTGAVAVQIDIAAMLRAVLDAGHQRAVALRLTDLGGKESDTPAEPLSLGQVPAFTTATMPTMATTMHGTRWLDMYGRRWRIDFEATKPMLSPIEQSLPQWIASGGGVLSLLLAGWLSVLTRGKYRADTARLVSERHLDTLFAQDAVGISLVDAATGRFRRVNQKFCDIMGYSTAELLARDAPSLSHPDDRQAELALAARLRHGEVKSYHLEKRRLRKDGAVIWIALTIYPMWRAGETPSTTVGVIQDITERIHMHEGLQHNEQRLRKILDYLPIGVLLSDSDGRIVYRNRAFVDLTGYDAQRVSNADEWWLHAYPNISVREQTQARWQALSLQAKVNNGLIEAHEYQIRASDGDVRDVVVSGVLMEHMEMVLLRDITQQNQDSEAINFLEHYDPLTGQANRKMLLDSLNRALGRSAATNSYGALMMLDVDHFKVVNETSGHEVGDLLLREIANRLTAFLHPGDTLARHGDDAFVLVVAQARDSASEARADAQALGQKILMAMRAPFSINNRHYYATVSIGVAMFRGHRENVDELMQQVGMAMYRAKAEGRDTLRFYDANMQQLARERASLTIALRTALEQGQFELHYQAQAHGGQIIGAEVLVRWRHPAEGLVHPARFIPLAEDTGLILPLGAWVLEGACRQLARWSSDARLGRLSLAVNVSPRQFYQSDFVAQVLDTLAKTGAEPRRLELELTEGLLLRDVEGTIEKMSQLKAHGIRFSLDDFGTGYSSLAYLKRLPMDQLKIDQSFVRDVLTDPNDAAIVRTIIALGRGLGLEVIAEGVETHEQREFLQRHKCQAWQGYLLSKPVLAEEFASVVAAY